MDGFGIKYNSIQAMDHPGAAQLGSKATAAGGGVKGAERVAGVGVQRSRTVGKAHTGVPQQETGGPVQLFLF